VTLSVISSPVVVTICALVTGRLSKLAACVDSDA
jgi:hypothetical protein